MDLARSRIIAALLHNRSTLYASQAQHDAIAEGEGHKFSPSTLQQLLPPAVL